MTTDEARAVLAEWPEQGPSFIDLDDKSRRDALAAMIAEVERRSAVPEDVEGLLIKAHTFIRDIQDGHEPDCEEIIGNLSAALRIYAARDAKLRREVEALLVDEETAEDYGNIEAGWNGAVSRVLALIDQQEGE